MKAKGLYTIRATKGIAAEMVSYEGSKILETAKPECNAKWIGTLLEEAYTTWLFTIEGSCNVRRWMSFGVGSSAINIIRK